MCQPLNMASPSPATRRRQTPELIDIPSSSQAASTSTSSSISNKEKKQEDYYIPSPTGPRPTAIYAKSSISSKSRKGHGEARTFWDEIGGGLRLKKGEPRVLVGLLLLGAVVRLWHIERPSSVVLVLSFLSPLPSLAQHIQFTSSPHFATARRVSPLLY